MSDSSQRIPARVADAAHRRPEATALVHGERRVTYARLQSVATAWARALHARRVGPEDIVGVALPMSPERVMITLGILQAGAAYLPLDPSHPPARLRLMLRDSGACGLITTEALRDRLLAPGMWYCPWDAPPPSESVSAPQASPALPHHLAYVLYTSGSTGTPKGVAIEHRNLENLCTWHIRRFEVGPEARATHLASFSFDASVWEVWPYLCAGACVHLIPKRDVLEPRRFLTLLRERAITHSFVPTPLVPAILEQEELPGPPLRYLLTGGERLTVRPPSGLPWELVNNYGPTELSLIHI